MTTIDKSRRAAIARETQDIMAAGRYQAAGRSVDIAGALARAVAASTAISPDEVAALVAERRRAGAGARGRPDVAITGESTLAAARRLAARGVLCLSFASARNPGGGFLNGARAQEESLCRGSALYPTLLAHRRYYDANRACRDVLYTDWAIHSPDVPVLRDDGEALLPEPVPASFLTMPAPNRGAMRRPDEEAVRSTLRRRIAAVLAIAAARRHPVLVLGAWGCGAFRNDPRMVAALFREALDEPALAAPFERITFAVLEAARDHGNRAAFEDAFRSYPG